LHGFLGLTRYYLKFVKKYGKIATPLISLLEKNAFNWTPTTDQAFHALKEDMSTTSVPALPEFKNTFFLECDASGKELE
jgi:hypothetical protein